MKLYSVMPYREDRYADCKVPLVINCDIDSIKFPKDAYPLLYVLENKDTIKEVQNAYLGKNITAITRLNELYRIIESDYPIIYPYIDCMVNTAIYSDSNLTCISDNLTNRYESDFIDEYDYTSFEDEEYDTNCDDDYL